MYTYEETQKIANAETEEFISLCQEITQQLGEGWKLNTADRRERPMIFQIVDHKIVVRLICELLTHKNRIVIEGYYPHNNIRDEGGTLPKITVAANKPAHVIAADITRRLLNDVTALTQQGEQQHQQEVTTQNQHREFALRVAAAMNDTYPIPAKTPDQLTFGWSGFQVITWQPHSARLTLSCDDPEQLLQVIAAIKRIIPSKIRKG